MASLKETALAFETNGIRGAGGRPTGEMAGNFASLQVLRLYVSHLKEQAPQAWSERQINFELFNRESPHDQLKRGQSVFNGLGMLRSRKSIPRLGSDDPLSRGMLRAEANSRLSGGLQILYHPYLQIISRPKSLDELQRLTVLCANSSKLSVFRYSAFGAVRTIRRVEDEIDSTDKFITEIKQSSDAWKNSFLDVLAITYGLLLESLFMRDLDRFQAWQKWFQSGKLKFEDWPRGSLEPRLALDRWVQISVENSMVDRIMVFETGFTHLHRQVVSSQQSEAAEEQDANSKIRTSNLSPTEEAWVFLAMLHGQAPALQDAAKLVRSRLLPSRFELPDTSEGLMRVRWIPQ